MNTTPTKTLETEVKKQIHWLHCEMDNKQISKSEFDNLLSKFFSTLLHQAKEEERKFVSEEIEKMRYVKDWHLGSEQNGCYYCNDCKTVDRILNDLQHKLATQDTK